MSKQVNGYDIVSVGALQALGLVRIVNSHTNRCVGTCAADEAEAFCKSLPAAGPETSAETSDVRMGEVTTSGSVSEVVGNNSAATGISKSSGVAAGKSGVTTKKKVGAGGSKKKPTEKSVSVASKNDAGTQDLDVEHSFTGLINALRKEYQASHAGTVWRVPVECCVAEGGLIRNSKNNASDRIKRTLSDEEIAMLRFSPDGSVVLCKEYVHSDGRVATVDKEGLSFDFDMAAVADAEKKDEFPLLLYRKGGTAFTTAWHVQDPATYADKTKAIVYDLETTGLEPDKDGNPPEILQLTIMDFNGNAIVNEYYKPEFITDWSGAAAVNGITPEMVASRPTFREAIPQIQKIFDEATLIVGYNSNGFDDKVLTQSGIKFNDAPHYDVMLHYQKVFGMKGPMSFGKGNEYLMQKLSLAYIDSIGVTNSAKKTVLGAHDALNDTRMTLEVFYALQTDNLVRKTPHWVSLFFRPIIRNKGKVFGDQEKATRTWADMFYQDSKSRLEAMRKKAGTDCWPNLPKVWDLAQYCK